MTSALAWISLASLVGAVIVMGIVTRYAIREMLAADLRALGATENYRLESVRAEQLRTALADEKRLHRLLLVRREAKRERKRVDDPNTGPGHRTAIPYGATTRIPSLDGTAPTSSGGSIDMGSSR